MDGTSLAIVLVLVTVVIALGVHSYRLSRRLVQALDDGAKARSRPRRSTALTDEWRPSLSARAAWKLAFSLVTKSLKQQKYERYKTDKDDGDILRFMEGIVHGMIDKAVGSMSVHGGRLREAGALAKTMDKRRALQKLRNLAQNRRVLRLQRRNGQLAAPKEHIATAGGILRSVRELPTGPPAQPQITAGGPPLGGRGGGGGAGQLEADRHLSLTAGSRGGEGARLAVPGQLDDEDFAPGASSRAGLRQHPGTSKKPRGVWTLARLSGSPAAAALPSPAGSLVISFGDPQRGQLGVEPAAAARQVSRSTILTIEELRGSEPVQVEAAGVASFVVGAYGQVWGFGSNRSTELGVRKEIAQVQAPQRLKSVRDHSAVQVASSPSASGQAHTVLLTAAGDVYTFGSSSCGALGQGPDVRQCAPVLCRLGADVKIRQVATGSRHSLFVSDVGVIYTVGDNRHGQLGHGVRDAGGSWVPKSLNVPKVVPGEFAELRTRLVTAGDDHNLSVMEDGRLFAWGANSNGQLGISRADDQAVPVAIRDLQDAGIVSLACGLRHSVVVSHHGQKVWSFGSNVQGQLGLGPSSPTDGFQMASPMPVKALSEQPNMEVVQVAAASSHTLAVLSTGEVYAWGDNTYGQLGFPRAGAGHAMSHIVRGSVQTMQASKQMRSRAALEVDAPAAFAEGVSRIFTPCRVVSLSLWKVRAVSTSDMHTLALAA